ncbi:hypothetical protein ID866_677 [Astraeus odoratus]|nr:hypothetical protein ID866_677 [Astraeus odoratus]
MIRASLNTKLSNCHSARTASRRLPPDAVADKSRGGHTERRVLRKALSKARRSSTKQTAQGKVISPVRDECMTLTENQVRPSPDLKLLLNTVKDVRGQACENKLSDQFYESLEGLLHDLRTVTMDNHDAEAFLKPVSKLDVPDYYDVITNPMDFQNMLKKVKSKQYKSKREFKDDLDLIWANCFTYNATEDHPLRQCAVRLKKKADRLLMNITDRKDRVDPPIPGEPTSHAISRAVARSKPNGTSHPLQDRDRDRTSSKQRQRSLTLSGTGSTSSTKHSASGRSLTGWRSMSAAPWKEVHFAESPALIRTQEGMSAFRALDHDVAQLLDAADFQSGEPGPSTLSHARSVARRLRKYGVPQDIDEDETYYDSFDFDVKTETLSDTGEKRKLIAPHPRQSKRPRLTPPDSSDEADLGAVATPSSEELIDLWWDAVQSDELFANGLPSLPSIATFPPPFPLRTPRKTMTSTTAAQTVSASPRKRAHTRSASIQEQSGTLLSLMNSNIKTLKRVRRTHTKFLALGFGGGEDASGAATGVVGGTGAGAGVTGIGAEREDLLDPETELPEEAIDERPWLARLRSMSGKGKAKGVFEIGERAAGSCLKWMDRKVLEHVGFQGTSSAALDVLTGVTSEFLFNVGRTMRFLCDKYAQTMTSEEIILHALFESGITRVEDLERYIKDDVVRHGTRLAELEKKLENAYREATSTDVLDDDALFNSDPEEEDALAMGTFADALGEDFLGLRELGIAAELGLSSLSVPRRLLKGKRDAVGGAKAKPAETLLPYPPPPDFLPITSKNVEDQIGLLRPYYHQRLASLAVTTPIPSGPVPPALSVSGLPGPGTVQGLSQPVPVAQNMHIPGTSLQPLPISFPPLPPMPGLSQLHIPTFPSAPQPFLQQAQQPPSLVSLPEDQPDPARTKVGPIGQPIKPSQTSTSVKKKGKGKEGAGPGPGGGVGAAALPVPTLPIGVSDGSVGVMDGAGIAATATGAGNGSTPGPSGGSGNSGAGSATPRKKTKVADLPPVIAASA